MSVLDEIVKAYDIRGTVPDQLNAEIAHALGVAFAPSVVPTGARGPRHAPDPAELVDAFSRGVMEQGLDVVDLGLASSDMLYYAGGRPRSRPERSSPRRTTPPSTTGSSCACLAPARWASRAVSAT